MKRTGVRWFAAKGLVILFAVMLVFTVLSRMADSVLVAKVQVENSSAKKIEHIINVTGTVDKGLEVPIVSAADILVKTVYVKEGERVAAGDVLAEFMPEQLETLITEKKAEMTVLQLQNQSALENQALAAKQKEKQIARATEDYENALKEKEALVNKAEEQKRQAEAMIDAQTTKETEESERAQLWQTYFEKQNACETAEQTGEKAVTEAKRALEDAKEESSSDYTAQIGQITIEEKKTALTALEKIRDDGNVLLAPEDGVVTGVFLAAGQKTTDTAAFTMAKQESGVSLTAEVEKSNAPYISNGDAAVIEKNGNKVEGFTVSAILQKEDGALEITVSSSDHAAEFTMGESIGVTITKQSDLYSTTVPFTALHTEQNRNYVYVIEEEQTVLGTQLYARKAEVQVLEKNSTYAAIAEGMLGEEDKIITDSDHYIEAGARVRLKTT